MKKILTDLSIRHPWLVISIAVVITAIFAAQFPNITIDTDPENMLPADAPVRIFEHETKENFGLSDFIAMGVVNEAGSFNPQTLNKIYNITAEIEEIEGIITMTARSMENVKKGGMTVIEFSKIRYNSGVDNSVFTERFLKNPPRKYIK